MKDAKAAVSGLSAMMENLTSGLNDHINSAKTPEEIKKIKEAIEASGVHNYTAQANAALSELKNLLSNK